MPLETLHNMLREQRRTIEALNMCIGGEDSTTTENLTRIGRLEAEIARLNARVWVGLSDAELAKIIAYPWGETKDYGRAIEQALKEKNNG